jgi:hypothetical protein
VGFELSPWSSHGYLKKTGALKQKEINALAADNFAKEMKRHRAFFKKHDVFCQIFTDESLEDIDSLFTDEIVPYLQPENTEVQLSFQMIEEFLSD